MKADSRIAHIPTKSVGKTNSSNEVANECLNMLNEMQSNKENVGIDLNNTDFATQQLRYRAAKFELELYKRQNGIVILDDDGLD